jgi:hypothetical protein
MNPLSKKELLLPLLSVKALPKKMKTKAEAS